MNPQKIELKPQEGPQQKFLSTTANIAIYGGAAGGGKSFALLLEPLRHFNNPKFTGVIFRRNTVQVRNPGGLWDESFSMYYPLKCHPREGVLEWVFPSGGQMKFAHLEYDRTVYDWQGSQIPFIGFDELTHFTEKQFFYMMSRNRSTSGIAGYIRATCNPDVDSWVRKIIDWWIGEDGYPIKERSGVVRWFIRVDDELIWGDTKEELIAKNGPHQIPKSLTFIASSVHDNKILMEKDPSYLSNLMALSRVERLRLLGGNWDVRPSAGMYFQREWFEIIDYLPDNWIKCVRYWDRAATKPNEQNKNPDYTVGLKMYSYPDGTYVVSDVSRTRDTPLKVEQFVKNIASQDTPICRICVEQDPGSAGVADADNYVRLLGGYDVRVRKPTSDKVTRALPVSAQCERNNVKILRGDWNDAFLSEAENFPPSEGSTVKKKTDEDMGHDDQIDGLSGAYNELCGEVGSLDVL